MQQKNKEYISFHRDGTPTRVNNVCKNCTEECKQHILVTLVRCPFFKPNNPELELSQDYKTQRWWNRHG